MFGMRLGAGEHGLSGVKYLGSHVIKRGRANNGETDQEYIGLRVGQRAKTIVIFLSSSIPKS